MEDCKYIIKWNVDNRNNWGDDFDEMSEICAGKKHLFPYILTYIKNQNTYTGEIEYTQNLNETRGTIHMETWESNFKSRLWQ